MRDFRNNSFLSVSGDVLLSPDNFRIRLCCIHTVLVVANHSEFNYVFFQLEFISRARHLYWERVCSPEQGEKDQYYDDDEYMSLQRRQLDDHVIIIMLF